MAESMVMNVTGGIPQGGGGAVVTERGSTPPAGTLPPVPPSGSQLEGYQPGTFVPPVPPNIAPVPPAPAAQAPAGIDPAQYAAFLEFQRTQAKPAPAAAPVPAATAQVHTDPVAALNLISSNAKSDPVIESYMGILEGTAPTIDKNRALGNALAYGDPNLIDKAYLRELGGDANGARLVAMAEGLVAHIGREIEATEGAIHTAAGGQAQWDAAATVFNQSAPAHIKSAVKVLVESGNKANSLAGAQMVIDFAKQSGALPQPGTYVAAGGAAPAAALALSKAEFQEKVRALDRNSRDYDNQYGELVGYRALGKQMGK